MAEPRTVMSVDFCDNAPVPTIAPDVVDGIIAAMHAGEPIRRVLREYRVSARRWYAALDSTPELAERYARGKAAGLDRMAEEMLEIADECLIGSQRKTTHLRVGNNGDLPRESDGKFSPNAQYVPVEEITTRDMVDRSKLMVDTRKWLLSKLAPKKYGDKLDLAVSGDLTITRTTYGEKKE